MELQRFAVAENYHYVTRHVFPQRLSVLRFIPLWLVVSSEAIHWLSLIFLDLMELSLHSLSIIIAAMSSAKWAMLLKWAAMGFLSASCSQCLMINWFS